MLFSVLFGCSPTKKIEALKPEPDNASPLVYDITPSFINIPVTIKIKDIENQVNKSLNGLIYDDQEIEADNLAVQVWKTAPIILQNENGKLKTVLPLKAALKFRYGINKFGINLFDTREFNLNGNVNLISDVAFSNWKLNTNTQVQSIDWNEKPTIGINDKDVNITFLTNQALKFFRTKIEKEIDNAIANAVDYKPEVVKALKKLSDPILMSSEYNSWLNITPSELYASKMQFQNETILINLGMKCDIATIVGQKPQFTFDSNKISMKTASQIPDKVRANITVVSSFKDASALMKKNFNGKEFKNGKRKMTVQNIELWQKQGKMVIALDISGSVTGTIYLTGIPGYDEKKEEIYLDQMDYVLDTKNRLTKTANWLLSGYILNKIEENCRYSIKSNKAEMEKNIQKYLKNYSPMAGVFVNGKLKDLSFKKIQLTDNAIVAFIELNGQINVNVDGLE